MAGAEKARMEWMENRLRAIKRRPIDLARHLDIKGPRVYEMLGGRRRLQEREMRPAAEFLGLSLEEVHDFVTGNPAGSASGSASRVVPSNNNSPAVDRTRNVPIFAVEAVNEREFVVLEHIIDHASRFRYIGANLWGVHMPNNTMAPWKEIGQTVFYDDRRAPHEGEYAIIKMRPNAHGKNGPHCVVRIVKYIHAYNGKHKARIKVRQYNPDKTYDISEADIVKVFRVVSQDEMALGYS